MAAGRDGDGFDPNLVNTAQFAAEAVRALLDVTSDRPDDPVTGPVDPTLLYALADFLDEGLNAGRPKADQLALIRKVVRALLKDAPG